jgi:hypothetical protein
MKRTRTGWTAALLFAGVVIGLWKTGAWLFDGGRPVRIVNQIWLERLPRDARDMVHQLVLLDDRGRHLGATGRSSRWRIRVDLLVWAIEGDRLRLRFPQDGDRADVKTRVWRCKGEAPEPFELCLELADDRGRKMTFYSRDAWRVRPRESLAALDAELPGTAALVAGAAGPAADEATPAEDAAPAGAPGPLIWPF